MTALLYIHNDNWLPSSNTVKKFSEDFPEVECMKKCLEMDNCYAIQAVYYNNDLDESELMGNVKWCALLEVDQQGANIIKRNTLTYGSNTAFGHIQTSVPGLIQSELQSDYQHYWIAVIVKGKHSR